MTTAGDFLIAMESYLGVAEHPAGSNHTRVGTEFGWDGVAWCAETVSCAAAKVGFGWLHTASVYQIRTWAQQGRNGLSWHPVWDARAGDIFCYHADQHTGAVSYLQGGGFVSIEGNWADRCQRVTRKGWSDIAGLARLPFAGQAGPAMALAPSPGAGDVPPTRVAVPGTLRLGDTGLEVALVQLRLNNLRGLLIFAGQDAWGPADEDGEYGDVTLLNVAAFQNKYGVTSEPGVYATTTQGKLSAVEAFCGIRYGA